jgi:hypothetical protein
MGAVWQGIITPILALAGIGGTLGGVYIGQRMSQKWQREQWVLDNRKEELRVLLDALAESLRVELTMYAGGALSPEQQRDFVGTHSNTMRIIRSRIFVADVVERCQMEDRWARALKVHQNSMDVAPLATVYKELQNEIVSAARMS